MIRSKLMSWREYLTPVTHNSTFQSTGQITPEEFVEAGDYLCHMFPTWEWNHQSSTVSGREFLPANRQFLVTRKVPCATRAEQLTVVTDDFDQQGDEGAEHKADSSEDWVVEGRVESKNAEAVDHADIDDLLLGMELESVDQDDDDMVMATVPSDTRHYDLYITYSTTYRVPKLYLVGFNSEGSPLTPQEMFQDIAPDYRAKTATIERLPFLHAHVTSVSIHPCKHANVMRVLMERVREVKSRRRAAGNNAPHAEDEWEDLQSELEGGLRVDQYLIVFLKFIASVTPGIEHDYTMEGW
ncbi:LANO_0A02520g1_1 [Lachancea nothofagi CBS 11611]|uniref:Autophagy-related protein 3 n=1 Tax=Lachancea nothofagi CBS 11611 TaxID=1266666 RepID=A0A1G4INM6_9SACH|nr:LANO_0A02520g1_1 [Lachancea nothofagi CBS 11611]